MEVKELGKKFRIARIAPVDRVKLPKPSPLPQASSCEMTVQIGIFFDGTGNRLDPSSGLRSRRYLRRQIRLCAGKT